MHKISWLLKCSKQKVQDSYQRFQMQSLVYFLLFNFLLPQSWLACIQFAIQISDAKQDNMKFVIIHN